MNHARTQQEAPPASCIGGGVGADVSRLLRNDQLWPRSSGTDGAGHVIQLWRDDGDRFAITDDDGNGLVCLVAIGRGWMLAR
jgi:hypothetical protein